MQQMAVRRWLTDSICFRKVVAFGAAWACIENPAEQSSQRSRTNSMSPRFATGA